MTKKEIRAQVRAQKRAMTEQQIVSASRNLGKLFRESQLYKNARSIYGYLPYNQEVRTVEMLQQAIADGKHTFISRGDGSGTHTKELALWPAELGIAKEAESFASYTEWYTSANTGMGACLVMAEEMGAYILTDKATFLTFQANGGVMG